MNHYTCLVLFAIPFKDRDVPLYMPCSFCHPLQRQRCTTIHALFFLPSTSKTEMYHYTCLVLFAIPFKDRDVPLYMPCSFCHPHQRQRCTTIHALFFLPSTSKTEMYHYTTCLVLFAIPFKDRDVPLYMPCSFCHPLQRQRCTTIHALFFLPSPSKTEMYHYTTCLVLFAIHFKDRDVPLYNMPCSFCHPLQRHRCTTIHALFFLPSTSKTEMYHYTCLVLFAIPFKDRDVPLYNMPCSFCHPLQRHRCTTIHALFFLPSTSKTEMYHYTCLVLFAIPFKDRDVPLYNMPCSFCHPLQRQRCTTIHALFFLPSPSKTQMYHYTTCLVLFAIPFKDRDVPLYMPCSFCHPLQRQRCTTIQHALFFLPSPSKTEMYHYTTCLVLFAIPFKDRDVPLYMPCSFCHPLQRQRCTTIHALFFLPSPSKTEMYHYTCLVLFAIPFKDRDVPLYNMPCSFCHPLQRQRCTTIQHALFFLPSPSKTEMYHYTTCLVLFAIPFKDRDVPLYMPCSFCHPLQRQRCTTIQHALFFLPSPSKTQMYHYTCLVLFAIPFKDRDVPLYMPCSFCHPLQRQRCTTIQHALFFLPSPSKTEMYHYTCLVLFAIPFKDTDVPLYMPCSFCHPLQRQRCTTIHALFFLPSPSKTEMYHYTTCLVLFAIPFKDTDVPLYMPCSFCHPLQRQRCTTIHALFFLPSPSKTEMYHYTTCLVLFAIPFKDRDVPLYMPCSFCHPLQRQRCCFSCRSHPQVDVSMHIWPAQ